MTTLFAFVLTLGLLIVVHEWGHYRMARACGVKVLRFSIGLGRPIWRRQHGETEWVIGMLPLGGYVKMLDEREGAVPQGERERAFNRRPLHQRAAIVAAGPLANLLLAVVLYAGSFWIGTDEPRAVLATPPAASVAEQAGVQAGDWVHSLVVLDGEAGSASGETQEIASLSDLRWHVTRAALAGKDVLLRVDRPARPVYAAEPAQVDAAAGGTASDNAAPDITSASGSSADSARFAEGASAVHQSSAATANTPGASTRHELKLALSSLAATDADAALMKRIGVSSPYSEPVLGKIIAGGPAERAGLQRGDRVLGINGQLPADAVALRNLIRASVPADDSKSEPAVQTWRVLRGNAVMEIPVQPARVQERGTSIGRIEAAIGSPVQMDLVRLGLLDGLIRGWDRTVETSVMSVKMFGRMLIGEASLRNLSGPLTIADYAGQSAQLGLAYYIGFLALVSISLGVLNLLPLPMLDGGHLLYYAIEAVIGRPLPDAWIEWLQRGGLVFIVAMMSLALFNDVARLAGLQ
ncbi:MAG: metalloprotease RseP [Pseudomonadota bacterium]|jgi:regulator of sigma E protease